LNGQDQNTVLANSHSILRTRRVFTAISFPIGGISANLLISHFRNHMSLYKVDYDFYTQQFDTTYPIFLQQSGINSQEYSEVLNTVALKIQGLHVRRARERMINLIIVLTLFLISLAALIGAFALTISTFIHWFWSID
jgi:hypothetical protein